MLFALGLAAIVAVASPPTPTEYYTRALATMNALPQPSFIQYELFARSNGIGIARYCSPKHEGAFAVGWGRGFSHTLSTNVDYRLSDQQTAFQEPDGSYCSDDLAIFKPTWTSVHDWTRYGLSEPPPRAKPIPKQTPPAAGSLKPIADVTSIAPASYIILENGSASCPDGHNGHALHLIALRDPDAHPLTDVVIDTKTMRFCSMRMRLFSATLAGTGGKGDMVLTFGDSGGYWLVTQAKATMTARVLGASVKHSEIEMQYSNMRFPQTIPDGRFTL